MFNVVCVYIYTYIDMYMTYVISTITCGSWTTRVWALKELTTIRIKNTFFPLLFYHGAFQPPTQERIV